MKVCLDKYVIEYNHYVSFQDSLTDYIYSVPVSTTNIGLVSWSLYIHSYCTFDYDFDINGCHKNRSVHYNEKSFLTNDGNPCRGWDVENHISTTNVNITFGWGQSSLT